MKALKVLHRLFHYLAAWCFILSLIVVGFGLFYGSMMIYAEYSLEEVVPMTYLLGMVAVVLAAVAIVFWAVAHIFREIVVLKERKAAKEAEVCDCGCCECCKCECEKEESDLDRQVEEVMKWKNLYVEGIITEREFIDKRNEILRLSK